MSETIIIALISAVVSLVVSLLATSLRNKADLRRIQKEQEHGYAKALFDKRVEYYPQLYNLFSGYAKVIRANRQNSENLNQFKEAVDDWNSKHALFFTTSTARFSARFRFLLASILNHDLASQWPSESWENLRQLIGYFEMFLKAEIGILITKPVGDVEDYEEAIGLVKSMIAETETAEKRKLPSS